MSRLHLFEWEDQPWFPALIRDAGTAYLRLAAEVTDQARPFVPIFEKLLERSGRERIIDLCSGGAGPLLALQAKLAEQGRTVRVTLTDLYPSVDALEQLVKSRASEADVYADPVDARQVPADLDGLRTLFNGLHHFRPDDARDILASAVRDRAPIAVVEMVPRHPVMILGLLFAPIMVMLTLPFLRPFRWGWVPLTYLFPVIPLFVLWDGVVSSLRNYTPRELEALAQEAGNDGYHWKVLQVPLRGAPLPANALIGWPV